MKIIIHCLIISVILCCVGCPARKSPDHATSGLEDADVIGADETSVDQEVEAAAKGVRRDGNGAIIEVDLRDGQVGDTLGKLSRLPKLRSVLLSRSDAGDESLEAIAKISTLENLDLRGCAVTDKGLGLLEGLQRLKSIKLSGKSGQTKVTDQGVASLAKISSLKVIALDFLPVTDQGLSALAPLVGMKELYLAGTDLSDDSVQTVKQFSGLTKLRLAATGLTSSGLKQLLPVNSLVELDVSDCPSVDDDAIETLAQFSELSKLNLYSTGVGNGRWESLTSSAKLKWLNVDKTAVGDEALDAIGKLKGLTFLHLGSTKITDVGLAKLAELTRLEKLIVTRTAVTQAGVDDLQKSLPDTEIQLIFVAGE